MAECIFCKIVKGTVPCAKVYENEKTLAFLDISPVNKGHTLIIPKRHFADFFDITTTEHEAVHDLIRIRRKQLLEVDSTIEGFNVGVNSGRAAGQTIFHCHVHLIPRRKGDLKEPTGGVRGVIPDKMQYIEDSA